MISDNQMDQFFSDRFRNYPSSVPEDMWERIMEKKKRDRILWLFFFRLIIVGVLLFVFTGGYLIFSHKKLSAATKTSSIQNGQPLARVANESKANQSIPSSAKDLCTSR